MLGMGISFLVAFISECRGCRLYNVFISLTKSPVNAWTRMSRDLFGPRGQTQGQNIKARISHSKISSAFVCMIALFFFSYNPLFDLAGKEGPGAGLFRGSLSGFRRP